MKPIMIYAKNVWKINLVYKWHILVSILSDVFNMLAMIFIWYMVYKSSNKFEISGYDFKSIALYTVMANLTSRIMHIEIAKTISYDIESGNITNSFIRPISYIKRLIGEAAGDIFFNIFLLFLPIVSGIIVYSYINNLNFSITISSIILYFIAVLFSIIINFEINLLVGFCSFYVNYIWGFIMFKNAILMLITGELFPINFYPDILVKLLKLTPFYYINYGPVSILLNKFSKSESFKIILIQVIWCLVLGLISKYFWEKSKTKLYINGG